MDELYRELSLKTSKLVTKLYSTSFSAGLLCMSKESQEAIYSIYGFLRQADEIVDSFHKFNKEELMKEFEADYYNCLNRGISLNLIINSFVITVSKYNISQELVSAFLSSMKSDLHNREFNELSIKKYIYGSAQVVGLMCLQVMTRGNSAQYQNLKESAKRLSSAFQKINFLRDIQNDTDNLSRNYFPILNDREFNDHTKREILDDIYLDFKEALLGIKELPKKDRAGVYLAYRYYLSLTKKIDKIPALELKKTRIRIADSLKLWLFVTTTTRSFLGKSFIN